MKPDNRYIRSLFLKALDEAEAAVLKLKGSAVQNGVSERSVQTILDELIKMRSELDNDQLPEKPRSTGIGRIVADSWPLELPAGELVCKIADLYQRRLY